MTEFGQRCDSPKQAMRVAQSRCISERGKFCEAYEGVVCEKCSVFKEGLKRRAENRRKEESETIGEINLGGNKVIQLRKGDHYFYLIIGKRYDENPEQPLVFSVERFLVLTSEEKTAALELFQKSIL